MAPFFLLLSPLFWALDIVINREAVIAGYQPLAYTLLRHLTIVTCCLLPALLTGTVFHRAALRRGCLMGALFGACGWLVGWSFSMTHGSHCGLISPLAFIFVLLWRQRAGASGFPLLPALLVIGGSLVSSWAGDWQLGDLGLPFIALATAAHTMLIEHKGDDEPAIVLILWQSLSASAVTALLFGLTSSSGGLVAGVDSLYLFAPLAAALMLALATAVELRWQSFVGARTATLIYGLDAALVAFIYFAFAGERLAVMDYIGLAAVFLGGTMAALYAGRKVAE